MLIVGLFLPQVGEGRNTLDIKMLDSKFYFSAVTSHDIWNVPIIYREQPEKDIVAACYIQRYVDTDEIASHRVEVDPVKFEKLSANWQKLVIAHELVHCYLDYRGHYHDYHDYHDYHNDSEIGDLMQESFNMNQPLSDNQLKKLVLKYKKGKR